MKIVWSHIIILCWKSRIISFYWNTKNKKKHVNISVNWIFSKICTFKIKCFLFQWILLILSWKTQFLLFFLENTIFRPLWTMPSWLGAEMWINWTLSQQFATNLCTCLVTSNLDRFVWWIHVQKLWFSTWKTMKKLYFYACFRGGWNGRQVFATEEKARFVIFSAWSLWF